MTLFSSLRARSSPLAASDEKDHDSDGGGGADEETAPHPQRTPLLSDASSGTTIDAFAVRIKLNDGRSTTDFPLDGISPSSTVRQLKERILRRHFDALPASGTNNRGNVANPRNRYLRLIVRGRMMAPDLSPLATFALVPDDVIHAVLAKEGARGGQQARMLRRMNGGTAGGGSGTGVGTGGGGTRTSAAERSLWRRVGIDANGVVVSSANDDSDDEEDSDDSELEEAHGELDVEGGRRAGTAVEGGRRRRRERRGFDRLRSTGMTRAEVSAIRHAFARPVDRYIERRRAMLRASRRLREGLGSLATGRATGGGEDASSAARPRSDTGGSTNSLLDEEEPNNAAGGGSHGDASDNSNEGEDGGAGNAANHDAPAPAEGEEILTDRLRMEDEWMSTQGPYSEFRMNLNTSNPLLLAAITGGAGTGTSAAALSPEMGPAGLLFRRNAGAGFVGGLDPLADEEDEGGAAFLRTNRNGYPPGAFPLGPYPYMGPVPPAGTDKDFVWGFILGFFVGFIMLFWVWMPTVPHKQKVGIISGISFQLGLNLLRKGHGGPSVSI